MADPNRPPRVDIRRSMLGRARGLGAAHEGTGTWLAHTLTSIALVPLTLWFICGMLRLVGASRADVAAWLHSPLTLALMLALLLMTFHHMRIGLSAVVEDYIQQPALRLTTLLTIRATTFFLGLACIVSVLRLGL
jgi:succinate dehydrogenase / fumarate reductase, membrane anchor subunit